MKCRIFFLLLGLMINSGAAWADDDKNFETGLSVLNRELKKEPKCGDLYQVRAQYFRNYKMYAESLSDSEKAIEFAKDKRSKALALCHKAMTETLLNRVSDAENDFKKSIELAPHNFLSNYEYGKFLLSTNRMPEAITYLKTAKSLIESCTSDQQKEIDRLLEEATSQTKNTK